MDRIYLFYNDRGRLVFQIPWTAEEEPFIVEVSRKGFDTAAENSAAAVRSDATH